MTGFEDKLKIGVSACLMGQPVRFNGGHSRSKLCLETLKNYCEFTSFCPEMAAGFGTPRPAMRLSGSPTNPNLILSSGDNQDDLAPKLRAGYQDRLPSLANLDGYILMRNSPSCGMERIKIYQENGYAHEQRGMGLFAEDLSNCNPLLPLEEEGRLNDPALRENFFLRVYTYHHFKKEVFSQPSSKRLLEFHSRYKMIIMAHSTEAYRSLGPMLANTKTVPIDTLVDNYSKLMMQALAKPARRKSNTNVLMHILGYLKRTVPSQARQNIVDIILRYKLGQLPLITPLTLLRHYVNQCDNDYIKSQRYFAPYPDELGLRNQL